MNAPLVHPMTASEHARDLFIGRVMPHVRADVGDVVFEAWFLSLHFEFIRIDGTSSVAQLSVATKWLRRQISDQFPAELLAALRAVWPDLHTFSIEVRIARPFSGHPSRQVSADPAPAEAAASSAPSTPVPPPEISAIPHDAASIVFGPRLTFAHFATGPSNASAAAAAWAMAAGDDRAPPILVIVGPTGAGKTHLCHAITAAAVGASSSVGFYDIFQLMSALRRATGAALDAAIDGFATHQLLVVDDLHHIAGAILPAVFGRVIRKLASRGHRLVVTTAASIRDLDLLGPETQSLLSSGVTVEVRRPDAGLRAILLDRFAERQGVTLPPDIRDAIAAGDVDARALEGAIHTLAHHQRTGAPMATPAAAMALLGTMVTTPRRSPVRIDEIIALTVTTFGFSRIELLSHRRTASVTSARQSAMWLAKTLTTRSLPEIGRRIGQRDHTTVINAIRRTEQRRAKDRDFAATLDQMRAKLEGATA